MCAGRVAFFCCGFLPLLVARGVAAGRFENLGPQLSARTFQAAAFTKDGDGREVLCAVVRSQPAAKLLVVDAATGALRRTLPLADANGAWAATTASDGSVYVGTEAKGKLFRWVPGEERARDLGTAVAGETFVWCLASGANGEIFGGTYPGCRVFRYSPTAGFSEPAPGPVVPGETYARSIVCDGAAQRLLVGVGVKAPHLVELDLKTGARREWLTGEFPGEQSVYTLSLSGDHVFAMLIPSHRTLIFDRRTRAIVSEVAANSSYQVASAPSPADGKIYFVREGNLMAFDPRQPRAPAASVLPVSGMHAMAWLRGAGDGAEATLAIFTGAGKLVRFQPASGRSETIELQSPEEPTVIQSLALGPDGRIWMGGYLSGGAAAFDPASGRTEQFKGLSQAESIATMGRKIYFGVYPNGRVFEFDTTKPWASDGKNPRRLAILKDQSRPIALLAVPELGRVFAGTIPEYGLLGGVLAVWDEAAEKCETFNDVVPRQAIASLAYAQGLVIGGTTIRGGLGIDPVEKDGRLFLWDPKANKKIFETTPVPGKGIVSGLTPMRDGTVWGFAQGTFFVFDLKTRKVIEARPQFYPEFNGRAMWQDASLLVHPSGDVYAVEGGCFLRIDARTREVTVLREVADKTHTRPIAMDEAGRIYVADSVDLWRYTP